MPILYLLLLLVAAVCFGVAAFARPSTRVNLVAAGLLAWVLVPLIQALLRIDA
jgi:uncharacterized membrane protein YjjB (DUF3815 family)